MLNLFSINLMIKLSHWNITRENLPMFYDVIVIGILRLFNVGRYPPMHHVPYSTKYLEFRILKASKLSNIQYTHQMLFQTHWLRQSLLEIFKNGSQKEAELSMKNSAYKLAS